MNYLHHFLLVIATSCLCILSTTSCEKESITTPTTTNLSATPPPPDTPCGTSVSTFYAGQHIDAGTVTVSNTTTDLIVTIQTHNNWLMGQTHVYVGALANMPTTPTGNPKIGNFPSSTTHNPMVNSYTYTYDLSTLDSCFIVAVHAEVHLIDANGDTLQSETAWANDNPFNNSGSWAGYIDYCKQYCPPCIYDTTSYNFYGGQTILVGNVMVTNDSTNLYVTYNTTGGWELEETHLYVGPLSGLPTNNANTPIPGQFPYSETHASGTTSYTYTIPLSSLNDPCYIIATHASVSKTDGNGNQQQETAWSDGTPFPNTNRWGWYNEYCTQTCE